MSIHSLRFINVFLCNDAHFYHLDKISLVLYKYFAYFLEFLIKFYSNHHAYRVKF